MSTGFWINADGLPLQFGTQKAIPEAGGDFVMYGESRVIEAYIPLVNTIWGAGNITLPGIPTTFSGTGTPNAAGILSMTTLFPLQTTAPETTSSSVLTLTKPQVFFEQVELVPLVAAAGGTSFNVGLVVVNPSNSQFVQVTDGTNTTNHIIQGVLTATVGTIGKKTTWNLPGATGISSGTAANNTLAGGGTWLGEVPLLTNSITPLPQAAYLSAIASGTFTAGLIKLRVKYHIFGNINY